MCNLVLITDIGVIFIQKPPTIACLPQVRTGEARTLIENKKLRRRFILVQYAWLPGVPLKREGEREDEGLKEAMFNSRMQGKVKLIREIWA